MTMPAPRFSAAVLALLASTAVASAQAPRRVLALTSTSPLLAQIGTPSCNVPASCTPALPPSAAPLWAGGTAHDPRDRTTWISRGQVVMKVDPRSGACTTGCGPVALSGLGATEYVTGLAFSLSAVQLFASTTLNRIVRYDASGGGCALAFVDACTASGLPVNHVISGLGTDDSSNTILWATSPWLGSSTSPFAVLHRASQTTPCTVICQGPMQDCAGNFLPQVTGLGHDACAGQLLATDGANIYAAVNPAFCFRSVSACCSTATSLGDRIIGLCVLPATEGSSGTPCFVGSTPACTSMSHTLGGEPVIGNLGFTLDLTACPAGSWSFLYANVGACLPGTDFGGILCTPVPLSPLAIFVWTGGGTGCTGAASYALPLPSLTVLCGLTISTRWWGIVGPPANNWVSNCLTWTISAT